MTNLSATKKLIDVLIEHWRFWEIHEIYYLQNLAPSLVLNPNSGDDLERETLRQLRQLLTEDEWQALPSLIAERRAGILREIKNDRLQREKLAREEQEAERIAAEKEERRIINLQEIRHRFKVDFLTATAFYWEKCSDIISIEEFEKEKFAFVKNWISANNNNSSPPDDDQISAISSVNGNIQVIARAGSGKTTTLVTRALFLLKHCRVAPSEILILAFNRKAALEVRRRLLTLLDQNAESAITAEINRRIRDAKQKRELNNDDLEAGVVNTIANQLNVSLPHIMTFHALAYAIVHPEESLLYNDSRGESQGLNRTFQQVIDDHLREPKSREKIRKLMLAHFREDWDRIIEGQHHQTKEEFLRFRRSLTRETLGGEYVKSYGEKIIADFLFEHDITYKYEQNHWWNKVNYRPDFTIFITPKSGLIIEYFGLEGELDYDEMTERKREYWKTNGNWTLIEFTPHDITNKGVNAFLENLQATLLNKGIECNRLSEDEIWNRVRDRAIDRFTTASVGFVSRCRKYSLAPAQLVEKINSYSPISPIESMFLDIIPQLYSAYLNRLSSTLEEDFDGLMQRAAQVVEEGCTYFQTKSSHGNLSSLKYLCIDEFQDFSDLFYRLLVAIRKVTPQVELFCVGDDWQAINGFAGSDLKFFNEFEQYIGKSRRLYISTNYRSASSIVDVSNALMSGLGRPALANKKVCGEVLICDLNKFELSHIEEERHRGDIVTPALLRVINNALASDMDVVLLCRRNALPWYINFQGHFNEKNHGLSGYLELVRSFFPTGVRERISISTTHKYKGLEKQIVVVLDLVARSYPLIHPDWTLSRLLGDSPEKIMGEERRLLYVALTRASEKLVIFTENKIKSPFLEELESEIHLQPITWADYPALRGLTTRLIVKVSNQERRGITPTIAIKNYLKAAGYQWQSTNLPGWAKSFPVKGFKVDILKSEVWSKSADGVVVNILDEFNIAVAQFIVDEGNWTCIFDEFSTLNISNNELT